MVLPVTFAFQNTSAVFPGMILFILFGVEYGFANSYTQFLGIILVILGLFLGAKNQSNHPSTKVTLWFKYALGCLLVQVLALTLLQVRCVFCSHAENVESFSFVSQEDASFLLGQFGSAFCIQFLYFFTQKKTLPKQSIVYGTLGGSANFFSTCLLLLATQWALPFEKAILFPIFAVGTIVLSNIWANRLYGEKFNFASNATCGGGILLGLLT